MNTHNETQAKQGRDTRVYRITIQGQLDKDWWEKFCDMRIITNETGEANDTITILEGPVRDQAELSGILNILFDLRLPVQGVEIINRHS